MPRKHLRQTVDLQEDLAEKGGLSALQLMTQPDRLAGIRRASDKSQEAFPNIAVPAEGHPLQLDHQWPVRGTWPLEEVIDPRLVEHVDPALADGCVGGVDEPIQAYGQVIAGSSQGLTVVRQDGEHGCKAQQRVEKTLRVRSILFST
jgi:hypothetical protein